MLKFLKIFLIFILLYHIIVTIFCYGIFGGHYQEILSIIRDGIWIFFIIFTIVWYQKHLRQFLKIRKYPIIFLFILLLFGIGISKQIGKSRYDIGIGIKYGLYYLIIFISAIYLGYGMAHKKDKQEITAFLRRCIYGLIIVVIAGFLRQIAKLIRPTFFYHIGYGPLKDFVFGDKPPIYYLTGYQGTLRRQGIFAGPNNYGYFLIAFFPLIIIFFRQRLSSIKALFIANKKMMINILIITLRIVAIIMTVSRTAFIGGIVTLALANIQRIRKHKNISRGILIIVLLGLIGLSILKGESTINHIKAKFGSIQYIIQQPEGYGLGTSGPAIHHNGTILPENYYLQLMLDIGSLGFLLWTIVILQITRVARKIQQKIKTITINANEQTIYLIRKYLNIGRVALLVMGLFLHVFEDSMVNYIFFVIWGICTGYLSIYIKKER